jgi:hypothetical protein
MWVLALILLLLLMAIALIYVWSHTPYGRLDWRVALILKASSWKKSSSFQRENQFRKSVLFFMNLRK